MTARSKRYWGTIAGAVGAVALILLKFKGALLAGLKALPLLKLTWLLKGSSSMLLSLGIYMAVFGWRYAVTIVVLIYIHEMGHYLWMKAKGLKPKAPVFVPFLGAYVAMTNLPREKATHAWVAYAGPLIGGLGAAVFYWCGIATDNLYLVAAAHTGFILNLLQLVPVRPFDGGFIADAISRWLAIPGVIALVAVALSWHSVLLLIISAVSIFWLISQWRAADTAFAGMTPPSAAERVVISLAYFGLAALLGGCYWASEAELQHLL